MDEPVVSEPIGDPPRHLTREAKKAWRQLVEAAPECVLTAADAIHLELTAELLAQFRANPAAFPAQRLTRLQAALGQIGLNPSARASLGIARGRKGGNPFERNGKQPGASS